MLQDTIVAMAREKVGLCYGDPAQRAAYRDFVYAFDGADAEYFARTLISCLMFAKALMAHNEVDGRLRVHGRERDVLRESYAHFPGQIDSLLQGLASRNGLLVSHLHATPYQLRAAIEPGCLVVHGAGGQLPKEQEARDRHLAQWGNIAHGMVVTGLEGETVLSVDGGQLDVMNANRSTAIAERERAFSLRGSGQLWLGGRRVNYVFPMHKMPVVQR